MTEPQFRKRRRGPVVPEHLARWFAEGGVPPLEILTDGTGTARLARLYETWRSEDRSRRRETLRSFLARVGLCGLGDGKR